MQPGLFEPALLSSESRPQQPVTPEPRPSVIDLFAGAGGLSEGFRQAGFRVIAGADVDPDACATYALNFPEADTICGDLRQPVIRERVLAAGRNAEVVVGGPPCQAFSQVRNHSRIIDDPRNSLYREFIATVAELGPAVFIMENVPGMAQMGVLEQVVEDLELGGMYEVNPQVVDAADFGLPQTRKRIVFLGVRRHLGLSPLLPVGTGATNLLALQRTANGRYVVGTRAGAGGATAAQLADPADTAIVTAAQAISDLRYLKAGRTDDRLELTDLRDPESAYQRLMRQGLTSPLTNVDVPRVNADTVTRLRRIPAGGNYRDLPDDLSARYLSDQRWGPSNGSGRLGRAHYYAYRRLHPDIWAWTLNTKADSVYHYSYTRALSVREFARIQSFPDRFVVTTHPHKGNLPGRIKGGARHSLYRQIGNAVPPMLAATVAREVKTLLRTAQSRAMKA